MLCSALICYVKINSPFLSLRYLQLIEIILKKEHYFVSR